MKRRIREQPCAENACTTRKELHAKHLEQLWSSPVCIQERAVCFFIALLTGADETSAPPHRIAGAWVAPDRGNHNRFRVPTQAFFKQPCKGRVSEGHVYLQNAESIWDCARGGLCMYFGERGGLLRETKQSENAV